MIERIRAMRASSVLVLPGLLLACTRADADGDARRTTAADGPIVVELFTSQGCSSCPPADQLLSRLAAAGSLEGRSVAPLAFHVDYWNDLGWADPYSLPAWTERQHQYSRVLGDARVYTPELGVAAAASALGSNLSAVSRAVRAAAPPAVRPSPAPW